MAYIGPAPNPGQNREVDDISSGFNGSEVNFTLQVNSQNVSPGSSNAIIVSLGGVVQNPGTDYTVASSTLTFTTAPASGLSFFGLVLGQQVDTADANFNNPVITGDLSIADKIVHTGDTNTAIRFPAADTITAETTGSERMRIDSSGRLLVGTTTAGHSDLDDLTIASSGHTGITIRSGTSSHGHIGFADGTSGNAQYIGLIAYDHANNHMEFVTNDAERLRIDSNGRALAGNYFVSKQIGGRTSSFQIQGTDGNTSSLSLFRYSADDGGSAITLGKGRASSAGGTDKLNNGDTVGSILWVGANNADLQNGNMAAIDVQADADQGGGDTPSRMRFFTVPDSSSTLTERMRIDKDGRLLVGRTSNITSNSVATCHVLEQITDFNWTFGIHCAQTNKVGMTIYYSNTTNNLDAFRFMVTTSTKFVISGNGNVSNANNSYGSVSDVALKENIVDANSQWNDIKNIKVRNFNFKESTGNHEKTMIGVVAQEIETVSPKLVYTNDDGFKEVSYSVLYIKAIKALQEAITKIEVLETKVAALEAA